MNKNYNPDQLLGACRVDKRDSHRIAEGLFLDTLLDVHALDSFSLTERERNAIKERIINRIDSHLWVSVGAALERLNSLATIPREFEGDADGIDALCYHLDSGTCEKAIASLKKVLARFEEMKRNG